METSFIKLVSKVEKLGWKNKSTLVFFKEVDALKEICSQVVSAAHENPPFVYKESFEKAGESLKSWLKKIKELLLEEEETSFAYEESYLENLRNTVYFAQSLLEDYLSSCEKCQQIEYANVCSLRIVWRIERIHKAVAEYIAYSKECGSLVREIDEGEGKMVFP